MKNAKMIKRLLVLLVALGISMSAGCDISPIPTPIPGAEPEMQGPNLGFAESDVLEENTDMPPQDSDVVDSDTGEEEADAEESDEEESEDAE